MAKRDNAPKKRSTKRQLTSNQQEWKHQITNLKRRIKDLEGLGIYVAFDIPSMPKKVTKAAIEKIKSIKRKELLKHGYSVDEATGEVFEKPALPQRGKTKEWRKLVKRLKRENDERFSEADEYDYEDIYEDIPVDISTVEIDRLKEEIASYGDSALTQQLYSILDRAIYERGLEEVAKMVEESYEELADYAQKAVKYKGDSRGAGNAAVFAQIVLGRTPSFNELASYTLASEKDENFEMPL